MIRFGAAICTAYLVSTSACAFAQTGSVLPEFEVASVKPTSPDIKVIPVLQAQEPLGMQPGGRFSMNGRTVSDLIQYAYRAQVVSLSGAPEWCQSARFDIVAKSPPGTSVAITRQMMQALLRDEFKLTIHREEAPSNVFVLVAGKKGPTLKISEGSGPAQCKWGVSALQQDSGVRLECTNMRPLDFVDVLPRFAPHYVDRPVVDLTELPDAYDFALDWTTRAGIDGGGLTILDAIEKQLGLKLQQRKIAIPVVVIDHIEQPPDARR
jgi:uncharacterized protein (TIGR03435 family)